MRPSKDATWLKVARDIAEQSTCLRRNVGCVLLDQYGQVLSTGWNGVASGQRHCNEELPFKTLLGGPEPDTYNTTTMRTPWACPGAQSPSGTNLDGCLALHAEWNALLQCRDVRTIITCYVTASPCVTCTKLLLNTSCRRIVYLEDYPAPGARELWHGEGRTWEMAGIPG